MLFEYEILSYQLTAIVRNCKKSQAIGLERYVCALLKIAWMYYYQELQHICVGVNKNKIKKERNELPSVPPASSNILDCGPIALRYIYNCNYYFEEHGITERWNRIVMILQKRLWYLGDYTLSFMQSNYCIHALNHGGRKTFL